MLGVAFSYPRDGALLGPRWSWAPLLVSQGALVESWVSLSCLYKKKKKNPQTLWYVLIDLGTYSQVVLVCR